MTTKLFKAKVTCIRDCYHSFYQCMLHKFHAKWLKCGSFSPYSSKPDPCRTTSSRMCFQLIAHFPLVSVHGWIEPHKVANANLKAWHIHKMLGFLPEIVVKVLLDSFELTLILLTWVQPTLPSALSQNVRAGQSHNVHAKRMPLL